MFYRVPRVPPSRIETLLDAIVERRTCKVTYTALSHGETNTCAINPLRMFEHDGGLYVFVQLPEPDVTRIIAVDRIERIVPTESTFEDPVDVEIRFSAGAARLIARCT